MFTGIIEHTGTVTQISSQGTNKTFWIKSRASHELAVDQSVSHDGVCLTVEGIVSGVHQVTAIAETLQKTNLNGWRENTVVNLERCLQMHGRLDGHIVQGHVDAVATCTAVVEKNGSWEYAFSFDARFAPLVIEKGSIALNGISLTLFNVSDHAFEVGVIPYTHAHTNMQYLQAGDTVNVEFDMIGKYVQRFMQFR